MKEILLQRVRGKSGLELSHLAQEHLQKEILAALYGGTAPGQSLHFLGGTCLRLCFQTRRFSEDLDFSLAPGAAIDVSSLTDAILRRLELGGFDVEMTWKERQGVYVGAVRITRLLAELGLSPMSDAKLLVKIDVDVRPPLGATTETTVFSEPLVMGVVHHDKPSLMAGKLHAILARRYDKGRDWYDLLWYLGGKVSPNISHLQGALDQIPTPHCNLAQDWIAGVRRKAGNVSWEKIRADVVPFLERTDEVNALTPENFDRALTNAEQRAAEAVPVPPTGQRTRKAPRP